MEASPLPVTWFGLTPADRDETARLVLIGDKRATTALLAAYAADREPLPVVGRRSLVRDGRGRDIAIIETTRIEIRRYGDVDEAFARLEGEGDKTLACWRSVHEPYLSAECARIGRPAPTPATEVLLEYFAVVRPCLELGDF
jgi:uncharacterized protein YhfF